MDCLLPGSPNAEAWIARTDVALRQVPGGRWPVDPGSILDPRPGIADRTRTLWGGFVDPIDFDAADLDLPDLPIAQMDPLIHQVLHVARGALAGAGVDRDRTGLLLANLSLPSSGAVRAVAGPYLEQLGIDVPWLEGGCPWDRWQSGFPAHLAARALGLGGGSCALDAACASGLYAVRLACDRLAAGEIDAAIAAAVNRADSSYLFVGFSQLHALSPTGTPRPLDRRADGLVVGEGAGAVLIKRLEDAVSAGDDILAVIRGGGLGNDGRKGNMLAPDGIGQLRTLRAAYRRAGVSPADIGYVECHATGTVLGDGVEIGALDALLSETERTLPVHISSAKALIGHTVTTAGIAGLIRTIGAVRDGFIPAAVGCEEPLAAIEESANLTVATERKPWPAAVPRRAGVSAFGFGGTNAHLIIEAWEGQAVVSRPAPVTPRLAVIGMAHRLDDVTEAPLSVSRGIEGLPDGRYCESVEVDPRRFRIPPIELADLLPQHLQMLETAADAIADAGEFDGETAAAIIGMGLDHHICEPVIRWASGDESVSPELTTSRVQGCLPNFVANRISAQLDLRGPSYTTSAGELSGAAAIAHAGRLLATGEADTVVVGAVDFPGHLGASSAGDIRTARPIEGAAALVVKRLEDAAPEQVYAVIDPVRFAPTDRIPASEGEALQLLPELLPALSKGGEVHVEAPFASATFRVERGVRTPDEHTDEWSRVLSVPHSGAQIPRGSRWTARSIPSPIAAGAPPSIRLHGGIEPGTLPWSVRPPAPRTVPPSLPPPQTTTSPLPFSREIAALGQLAASLGTSTTAMVDAHERFLGGQLAAQADLERMAAMLQQATAALTSGRPIHLPAPPPPPVDMGPPRTYDRAALERHAEGALSGVFGPSFADLDAFEPRVRMPMAPLLLCDRVVEIEGERGSYGPAHIVTEYDVPIGEDWSADGRPPAVVVVESGQADLFLVSYLGIDEECRGERIYRLLDCDLTFHAARPKPGETLRHDIRIAKFVRLGATTLFYFEYDCITVSDGQPLLTMRNGCAGFFTPAELAHPRGVDTEVVDLPQQAPLAPLGPATTLDETGLCLPTGHWRLVHEVDSVRISGPPYGLGAAVYTQTLRDDDWFNPCHFKGDPCMPGTLMYDGCLQAVQLWLLGHGIAKVFPNAAFEPMPGVAAKLRCRGQVVPGHAKLQYEARIKRAGLHPTPWAIADVILSVDGTPVVYASDVGVVVDGERVALPEPIRLDDASIMEFSVGAAERAFGAAYARYDLPGERCPRMPGPPYLTMSRVADVEGPPMEIAAPRTVVMEYDVHPEAWYFLPNAGESMPFAILLETALQPCGWLTAWQGQSIKADNGVYFRNLGGTATQFVEVWPDAGTLTTRATQTSVSEAGGLMVQFYQSTVYAGETKIFETTTHFGYFDESALANQKGLQPGAAEEERRTAELEAASIEPIPLASETGMPRHDWLMLDQVIAANPAGGREKLGYYVGSHAVDPEKWFFYAHFHLDPVMPGSLGLEALLQLARWVLHQRVGPFDVRLEPLTLNHQINWKYRGQVLRHKREMTVELEVLELVGGASPRIRCSGLVRADGLPIYSFDEFGLGAAVTEPTPTPPATVDRPAPAAALLDHFDVQTGQGVLHLDPARHPWLADHCPTVTVPAVPMAFAAEIAAEAASLLHPDKKVIGLPSLDATQWIHTGDGPVDVLVDAQIAGDTVDVTLSVHVENKRFPALSGPKVHMRATVELGDDWHAAEGAPEVLAPEVEVDIDDYYNGGHTFHGPLLQAMTALTRMGTEGATATFETRADGSLLGIDSAFVLDPLLLDTATHPMWSAEPERWVEGLESGHLAYPIHAENLRFFGPRPAGEVQFAMTAVAADSKTMTFAVHMGTVDAPWCAFEWTEAIVDAGPLLGRSAAERRDFLWERKALPQVTIGQSTAEGWRVEASDLVEPLEGTLVRLTCSDNEVDEWRRSSDRIAWSMARIAAKEAVRSWLRDRIGRDVHPKDLVLLAMRPDRFVITEAGALDAQEYCENLGPTRFELTIQTGQNHAIARMSPI